MGQGRGLSRYEKDQDTTGPRKKQARAPPHTHEAVRTPWDAGCVRLLLPSQVLEGHTHHLVRLSSVQIPLLLVQLQSSSPGDTLSSEVARPMPVNHRHQLRPGEGRRDGFLAGCGTGARTWRPLLAHSRGISMRRQHTWQGPLWLTESHGLGTLPQPRSPELPAGLKCD